MQIKKPLLQIAKKFRSLEKHIIEHEIKYKSVSDNIELIKTGDSKVSF